MLSSIQDGGTRRPYLIFFVPVNTVIRTYRGCTQHDVRETCYRASGNMYWYAWVEIHTYQSAKLYSSREQHIWRTCHTTYPQLLPTKHQPLWLAFPWWCCRNERGKYFETSVSLWNERFSRDMLWRMGQTRRTTLFGPADASTTRHSLKPEQKLDDEVECSVCEAHVAWLSKASM